jgi:hypothetical protein
MFKLHNVFINPKSVNSAIMAASINVSKKMKNEQFNTVGTVVEKETKHMLVI